MRNSFERLFEATRFCVVFGNLRTCLKPWYYSLTDGDVDCVSDRHTHACRDTQMHFMGFIHTRLHNLYNIKTHLRKRNSFSIFMRVNSNDPECISDVHNREENKGQFISAAQIFLHALVSWQKLSFGEQRKHFYFYSPSGFGIHSTLTSWLRTVSSCFCNDTNTPRLCCINKDSF